MPILLKYKLPRMNEKKRKAEDSNGGLVEVKSSSGKSLLFDKATLERVMGSKGLLKVAVSKTPRTDPDMQAPSGESTFKKVKQVEVGESLRGGTRSIGL